MSTESQATPQSASLKRLVRQFRANVAALNKTLSALKREVPGAEYYLANSTLNLMSGPHHEGNSAEARQDRVIASANLRHSDGGDW